MSMECHGGIILTKGNQRTWRKICPSATLSITYLTWTDLGMNQGLCGKRLSTNHLSHSTASFLNFCNFSKHKTGSDHIIFILGILNVTQHINFFTVLMIILVLKSSFQTSLVFLSLSVFYVHNFMLSLVIYFHSSTSMYIIILTLLICSNLFSCTNLKFVTFLLFISSV
jgi:hypothetical protein